MIRRPPRSSLLPYTTLFLFFFNDTATTEIYTLSLHDALPILFHALASQVPSEFPMTLTGNNSPNQPRLFCFATPLSTNIPSDPIANFIERASSPSRNTFTSYSPGLLLKRKNGDLLFSSVLKARTLFQRKFQRSQRGSLSLPLVSRDRSDPALPVCSLVLAICLPL